MYELMGYNRKTGVFEKDGKSYPYDNFYLHCRKANIPKDHEGDFLEIVKVPVDLMEGVLPLVGEIYAFYYDKYQKVTMVQKAG